MSAQELIARLQAAKGPCRELDRALMLIQHEWTQRKLSDVANHQEWCWVNRKTGRWRTTARDGFTFTASIDYALTLVPPNCVWKVMTDYGGLNRASISNIPHYIYGADAPTPALAICIAALRARHQGEG